MQRMNWLEKPSLTSLKPPLQETRHKLKSRDVILAFLSKSIFDYYNQTSPRQQEYQLCMKQSHILQKMLSNNFENKNFMLYSAWAQNEY